MWIVVSLLFLLGGGVLGSLLGLERVQSGFDILDKGTFSQIYTLHGEVAVLLFLVPKLAFADVDEALLEEQTEAVEAS